jgi:hypothetical protein
MTDQKQQIILLKSIVNDLLWMAARYAHGRHTYAPSTVRDSVEKMQRMFPNWEPRRDECIEKPKPEDIGGMSFREDYLDDVFNK